MKTIAFAMTLLVLSTAAFSQNCIRVLPPTFFSDPAPDGTYSITVNYATDGNKTLETIIKCGNTIIFTDCSQVSGTGNFVFSGLNCPEGIAALSATFTPRTGSCNSAQCGNISTIPMGGVLPLKLNSFSAERFKQEVSLNWNTEFETGTQEFIVERAEATEFRSVGSILANGNSSALKSYSFNDKNENAGVTYYRLKNVDLNGRFTYSEIKTVKGTSALNDITVFPNPARSNSKISLVGVAPNSSIQLLDFSGKVLKNMNSTSNNSLDLSGVKNGTYLIRIIDKSTNQVVNKKLSVSN